MKSYVPKGQIIVNVAKGIEESTLMTLTEQIAEELPQADAAVLSGPSHCLLYTSIPLKPGWSWWAQR